MNVPVTPVYMYVDFRRAARVYFAIICDPPTLAALKFVNRDAAAEVISIHVVGPASRRAQYLCVHHGDIQLRIPDARAGNVILWAIALIRISVHHSHLHVK